MSVVRINAVTVPVEDHASFAERFAGRAGAVEQASGFESFMLLRPVAESTGHEPPAQAPSEWFVLTVWRDEASYHAWLGSPEFLKAHAREIREHRGAGQEDPPVGVSARLLAFNVEQAVYAAPAGAGSAP